MKIITANDKKIYGERLKIMIQAAGISQKDIARVLNITPRAVTSWVQGRTLPHYATLSFLNQHFGFNILFFINGDGPPLLSLRRPKKKKITKEKETTLFSEHHKLILLLENYCHPWKIIDRAYKNYLTDPNVGILDKVRSAGFEGHAGAVLAKRYWFAANPWWEEAISYLWSVYLGVLQNKEINAFAVAYLAVILYSPTDPDEINKAVNLLVQRLSAKINNKRTEGREIKVKMPKACMSYLKEAVESLVQLVEMDILPSFCFYHNKVYWSTCPKC